LRPPPISTLFPYTTLFRSLLDAAEASGQLRQVELNELVEPLELDPLELQAIYQELDRRGIELLVEELQQEPEKEAAPPPPVTATDRKSVVQGKSVGVGGGE